MEDKAKIVYKTSEFMKVESWDIHRLSGGCVRGDWSENPPAPLPHPWPCNCSLSTSPPPYHPSPIKSLSPHRTCWKQTLFDVKRHIWFRIQASKSRAAQGCSTSTQLPPSQRTPSHCQRAGQGARRAPGMEKAAACPEHPRGKAASPTIHCGSL